MVICRYYGTPGGCRYGNNCKYDHVDPPSGRGPSNNSHQFSSSSAPPKGASRYTKARILEEIQWPLSAVANKDAPEKGNVIEGDISPEELRLQAYQMASRGMSAEVQQREAQIVAEHHAKIDGLSRGGMEATPSSTANNAFQVKDPFAQSGSTPAQQNQAMPFGGGFDGSNGMQTSPFSQQPASFLQPQQSFPQPPQPMAQNPSPFSAPNPQQASMFPPSQPFQQPQVQQAVPNPTPVSNPSDNAQFSAAQFGFAKIPEAAPPPRYY
eukprot:GFKZ01009605.1.p1 GENE.GFKZ01009605.1~~GFKZ01009605.1.p1  ORF type:complete len:267 (+),score=40.08 GFKZ01009605.1:258-1058(+)